MSIDKLKTDVSDYDSAMFLNLCAAPARPSLPSTDSFRTTKDTTMTQCLNHDSLLCACTIIVYAVLVKIHRQSTEYRVQTFLPTTKSVHFLWK